MNAHMHNAPLTNDNREHHDSSAAAGRGVRLFGLRSFGPLCDIRVGGRVKLSFGLSKMEIDTNIAKIARNVDKIAANTRAIETNGS